MIKLRDFQKDCVQRLDLLNSAILIAATGSGKTMMGAALSWKEIMRGGKVAFVVPRDNLARQTAKTMERWGLNTGYVLGGEKENRGAELQIVSYQSLGSKVRSLEWISDRTTLWIVDECHITAFSKALEPYLSSAKRKIGLTATPWQFGGKRSLLNLFKEVVFAPPPKELMERGFLTKPIYFCPQKKGKLNASPEFIFEQWSKLAWEEKTFVFAGSIAESDAIAKHYQENGINAISVTSKTPSNLVEPIFNKFDSGEISVLVSCNKLAEGCDIPTATCVILANRTESKSGAIQRIGRVLRVAQGKQHAKVIDCVGIIKKFGRIEDLNPDLTDFALKDGKGGVPMKACDRCFGLSFIGAKFCLCPTDLQSKYSKYIGGNWVCGHPFDSAGTVYENPGELQRLSQSNREQQAIASFHHLLLEDFLHGTKVAIASFQKEYKYYPERHWIADASIPDSMRSGAIDIAWRNFKQVVQESIPTTPIQLNLF